MATKKSDEKSDNKIKEMLEHPLWYTEFDGNEDETEDRRDNSVNERSLFEKYKSKKG